METLEIMACQDCLFVAEYGNEHWDVLISDLGEEIGTTRYEEITHSLEALGESVHAGDPEKAEEFSWNPCECCGSTLGGSRYELVVML